MKKTLLWLPVLLLSISLLGVFSFFGCKAEEAAEEEVMEETGEEAEEVAEEAEEVAEEETDPYIELYGDINGAEINFLGWQGYDAIGVIEPFLEKYNITINPLYVNNNEEIFTKLKAGGGERYDLVTPYHGIIPAFLQSDLLAPLDLSLVPNYDDIIEYFKEAEWNKVDGETYSIPFVWGAEGILYNADEVIPAPTSYEILLDPQYKNKIIMIDENIGSTLDAALWLGFKDASMLTPEQLEQVYDKLVELKKNIRYISPNFGDVQNALVSGEALMCFAGWDAVALWAQQDGVNIQNAIPKEGTHGFIDNYCIPKDAKNQMAAYAFINYLLEPEVHAAYVASLSSAVVNMEAIEFLPDVNKNAYPYDNMDEFFTRVGMFSPTPLESDEYATQADWTAMWERFKMAE